MMTRRFFLAATAATTASAALPAIPAAGGVMSAPPPLRPAWVVGTPGEFNWYVIRASTREKAIRKWIASQCEGEEPCSRTTCQCEVAAYRTEEFDDKPQPTPGDWIRAGLGHTCSRCGEEMDSNCGRDVGDEAVCDYCLADDERTEIEASP